MDQHAWPDRTTPLQSTSSMTLSAMTIECEGLIDWFIFKIPTLERWLLTKKWLTSPSPEAKLVTVGSLSVSTLTLLFFAFLTREPKTNTSRGQFLRWRKLGHCYVSELVHSGEIFGHQWICEAMVAIWIVMWLCVHLETSPYSSSPCWSPVNVMRCPDLNKTNVTKLVTR